MFLDKLEVLYKKNENVVKVIAGISLGAVIGMWAYGKYKQSKVGKIAEKIENEVEEREVENG